MASKSKKTEQKPTLDEFKAVRKRDAMALAQLILDIWLEKKQKDTANSTKLAN